jgi:hypothetical protein
MRNKVLYFLFMLIASSLGASVFVGTNAGTLPTTAASAPTCTPDQVADVLSTSTANGTQVNLTCSLNLSPGDVIHKSIVIQTSGVSIQCNGATIDGELDSGPDKIIVTSSYSFLRKTDSKGSALSPAELYNPSNVTYSAPSNVSIDGCMLNGRLHIYSGGTHSALFWQYASYSPNATAILQASAPSNIRVSNMDINAGSSGWTPFYIGPGVTYVTLENSNISGNSGSTAIYLDAESSNNVIRRNHIHTTTSGAGTSYNYGYHPAREQIAVDGSAFNIIVDNTIENSTGGGVWIYRNCGENSTVRHQMPTHNLISNNNFIFTTPSISLYQLENVPLTQGYKSGPTILEYMKTYTPQLVYVGSRGGVMRSGSSTVCGEDSGRTQDLTDSSQNNRDFAEFNVIYGNQVDVKFAPFPTQVYFNKYNPIQQIEMNFKADLEPAYKSFISSMMYVERNESGNYGNYFGSNGIVFDTPLSDFESPQSVCFAANPSAAEDVSTEIVRSGHTSGNAVCDDGILHKTADISQPAFIAIYQGQGQSATVASPLATEFTVTVTDVDQQPVNNATVDWAVTAGEGSLSEALSSTNKLGHASSTLTLGKIAGTVSVTASVRGTSLSQTFTATANPGAPASIYISEGNQQSAYAGSPLPYHLRATVKDSYNNLVPGVVVDWALTQGKGSFSSNSSSTNIRGHAITKLTLGNTSGVVGGTATVHGMKTLSASFTETAVVQPMSLPASNTVTPNNKRVATER